MPGTDAAVMRGVDVDADGEPIGLRVQSCGNGAGAFGERARSAAVQEARRLRVALDRHAGHDPFGLRFQVFDAEALVEWCPGHCREDGGTVVVTVVAGREGHGRRRYRAQLWPPGTLVT